MNIRRRTLGTLSLVLALGGLGACQPAAKPPTEKGASGKLVGSYEITAGSDGAGSSYTGSVDIKQDGGRYLVNWTVGESEKYGGVGIERGDVLGVGWGSGKQYGVVVYRIKGGNLSGLWAVNDSPDLGSEELTGAEGLSGKYKIASSYSPLTKAAYHGVADISAVGSAYKLEWSIDGGESYLGLGVKQGDYLIVAWPASAAGVVAYEANDGQLEGVWSQWKGTPGKETLKRK